jgi:aminopeptidase
MTHPDPESSIAPSTAPLEMSAETTLLARASQHVAAILSLAVEHRPGTPALLVYDRRSELSRLVAEAYRLCLPGADHRDFDACAESALRAAFTALPRGGLAVLVQSSSFRLDAFRIRVELFKQGLKVIEHPHLERMTGPEVGLYVDSLAYDPDYYRRLGPALKQRIDRAQTAELVTPAGRLTYRGGLEPAKLNIGDYRNMANVGGQYPIGEVFTEARDLTMVSGRLQISHFGDTDFRVNQPPQPINLIVERGEVLACEHSTEPFERVLETIRGDEGAVTLRELGFGLNRAFSLARSVSDIGTFERMCGVHLSLGKKHATYPKAGIDKQRARYHVDVFARIEQVLLDGESVYRDGAWLG